DGEREAGPESAAGAGAEERGISGAADAGGRDAVRDIRGGAGVGAGGDRGKLFRAGRPLADGDEAGEPDPANAGSGAGDPDVVRGADGEGVGGEAERREDGEDTAGEAGAAGTSAVVVCAAAAVVHRSVGGDEPGIQHAAGAETAWRA